MEKSKQLVQSNLYTKQRLKVRLRLPAWKENYVKKTFFELGTMLLQSTREILSLPQPTRRN